MPSERAGLRDKGPEVEVSTDQIRIFKGDTPGATFTVVLTGEPTGTVTITPGGTAGTDVRRPTHSPSTTCR